MKVHQLTPPAILFQSYSPRNALVLNAWQCCPLSIPSVTILQGLNISRIFGNQQTNFQPGDSNMLAGRRWESSQDGAWIKPGILGPERAGSVSLETADQYAKSNGLGAPCEESFPAVRLQVIL